MDRLSVLILAARQQPVRNAIEGATNESFFIRLLCYLFPPKVLPLSREALTNSGEYHTRLGRTGIEPKLDRRLRRGFQFTLAARVTGPAKLKPTRPLTKWEKFTKEI